MRTIIFISTIMLISFTGFCQNLQFSQVLLVNSSQTVPSGKVWKLEKLLTASNYVNGGNPSSCVAEIGLYKVLINGVAYFLNAQLNVSSTGGTGMMPGCSEGPLWLPNGTTIEPFCAQTLLSIIEFNITP